MMIILLYGTIATWIAVIGYSHPCNYETQAQITACIPDSTLGFYIFNISYRDNNNNYHDAKIRSSITCFAQQQSYNITQYIDICYSAHDPNTPLEDYVYLSNPNAAKYLLLTGIVSLIVSISSIICICVYVDHLIRTKQINLDDTEIALVSYYLNSSTSPYYIPPNPPPNPPNPPNPPHPPPTPLQPLPI
jgi:hypothetical protein